MSQIVLGLILTITHGAVQVLIATLHDKVNEAIRLSLHFLLLIVFLLILYVLRNPQILQELFQLKV